LSLAEGVKFFGAQASEVHSLIDQLNDYLARV
jgi:hypothetical protein